VSYLSGLRRSFRWIPLSEEEENTLGDIIEDVRDRGPMEITDQQRCYARDPVRVLGQLTLRGLGR